MSNSTIRKQFNDLLGGRYHWQQGIHKFYNKSYTDALTYCRKRHAYEIVNPKTYIYNIFTESNCTDIFVDYVSKPTTVEWTGNGVKLSADNTNQWCRTSVPFTEAPISGEILTVSFDVRDIDETSSWRMYVNDDITDTGNILGEIDLEIGHYSYEVTAAAGGNGTLDLSILFMSAEVGGSDWIELDNLKINQKRIEPQFSKIKNYKSDIFNIQDYYSVSGLHYSVPFNDSEPAITPKTRTGDFDFDLFGVGDIDFVNNEYGKFVGGADKIQLNKTGADVRNAPYIDFASGDGYSIGAWIRPTGNDANDYQVYLNNSYGDWIVFRTVNVEQRVKLEFKGNGNIISLDPAYSNYTDWHHHMFTWKDGNYKAYVDGILEVSGTSASTIRADVSALSYSKTTIGSYSDGGNGVDMDFKDFITYTRALSHQEVVDVANCTRPLSVARINQLVDES